MQDAEAGRVRGHVRGRLIAALLATLSALAFALSFPLSEQFVAGWPLVFVWPALLGAAARIAPRKRELVVGTAVPFLVVFLAHEWWMRHITELGMPLLAMYLAGWTVVLALLMRRLGGTAARPRWPFAVVLPIAVVCVEHLRGDLVCSGYAWFFAAHPLVEWTEVAQIASIGGGWLLSALAAFVSGAVLDAIVGRGKLRIASPIIALTALAAAFVIGAQRIAAIDNSNTAHPPALNILSVQTDLPMSNKLSWTPEEQVEDFLVFARLTIEGAATAREAGATIDLALWPETTLPGLGLERDSIKTLVDGHYYPGDRYLEALRDLSTRIDAPMLVGSPAYIDLRVEGNRFKWKNQFNSAYLVGPDGARGRTDKIYLTPFGEMMPIISNWDWLETQLLDLGAEGMTFDLDAAAAPSNFTLQRKVTQSGAVSGAASGTASGTEGVGLGVPICFEITMPWASRRIAFPDGKRAAGVLLNLSNDGWFGPSRAGRRQHLQVAQLRAIELDTPVVRSANTGISASIDAVGRIEAILPSQQAGTLLVHPVPSTSVPTSVFLGDSVAFLALLGACVGLLPVGKQKAARPQL